MTKRGAEAGPKSSVAERMRMTSVWRVLIKNRSTKGFLLVFPNFLTLNHIIIPQTKTNKQWTVMMLDLYIIPLYSNVQIAPRVSSLLPIFPAVFLNPSKPLCCAPDRKANIPFFPYCFLNFASTAFVVLRVQNSEDSEIRERAWNSQCQPW